MIAGSRRLPVQHLGIRVPWHDAGWVGTVCRKPASNMACRALRRIADAQVSRGPFTGPASTVHGRARELHGAVPDHGHQATSLRRAQLGVARPLSSNALHDVPVQRRLRTVSVDAEEGGGRARRALQPRFATRPRAGPRLRCRLDPGPRQSARDGWTPSSARYAKKRVLEQRPPSCARTSPHRPSASRRHRNSRFAMRSPTLRE